MKNIYQEITDKIIQRIENVTGKWDKGFISIMEPPRNLDGRLYTGINFVALYDPRFEDQVYGTFEQVQRHGGTVKKGEKSQIAVFYKKLHIANVDEGTGEIENKKIPYIRYFNVFNIAQTSLSKEQIKAPEILEAEAIYANMPDPPAIVYNNLVKCASYSPTFDQVTIPRPEVYQEKGQFFKTLFHELGHATGHAKRLNRPMVAFKDDYAQYAREELIAEMTASFICARTGKANTDTENNTAQYLKHWLEQLRENPKYIFSVCSQAQRAVNLILNENENID